MLRDLVRKSNNIFFVMIVTFLVYLLFIYMVSNFSGRYAPRCTELTSGWTVTYNGETTQNADYNLFIRDRGNEFREGDTIICERVMEDLGEKQFPSLMIKTRQSAVEIFMDDEKIYSADMEMAEKGRFIGRRVRFVNLPKDYAGKTIRAEVHLSRGGYSRYGAPVFGEYRDLRWMFTDSAVPALATGLFLFQFGLVFLFIAFHFSMKEERWMQMVSAGLCTMMGIWILCYNDFLMMFIRDYYATELEYLAFYMMLPLMVLFVGGLYHSRILKISGRAGIALCAVLFVIHLTGLVTLDVYALPYQVLVMAVFAGMLVYFFAYRVRKNKAADVTIREIGLIIVAISMMVYYVIYLLDGLISLPNNSIGMQMPCIGMLSFATMQILYYYTYVSENYAKQQDLETLTEMAFVDVLTGLPNRKSADNLLEQLNNVNADYCILSLDVNGLKVVNDTRGHNAGDKLLQLTAGVLNRCFREGSFRARLSGDEFLVIMRDTTIEKVDACIRLTHRMFLELDRMEPEVSHSISVGYAFKSELPRGSAQAVYNMADERMYKAKREYYERMRLGRITGKEAKAI